MSTSIRPRFQARVVEDGETVWQDITTNFDRGEELRDRICQHYNLFAWIAGVRDYNGITPIVPEMRGRPDDMKRSSDPYSASYDDSDYICHWLLGSEIIDAIDRIHPVTERGVVNTNTRFDGKEPWCYSRYNKDLHSGYLTMHSDQVKRDTGYVANLWDETCNFHKYDWACNPHNGFKPNNKGSWERKIPRVRPSVEKHLNKLRKYRARVGTFDYVAEWLVTPRMRREEFQYFTQEISRLMFKHGEIRMLMDFL